MEEMILDALRPDLEEAEFDALALGLLRAQAGSNPVYRNFLRAACFESSMAGHWKEFPALPVEAFRSGPVCCFDHNEAGLVFETSGTSGKASGRHYLKNGRCYEKALATSFRSFMPDLSGHRWISLVPSFALRPHSSLAYMIRHLAAEIPRLFPVEFVVDGDFVLDRVKCRRLLETAVERGEKVALFGTSFALAQASEFFLENGLVSRLPEGSVVFDTGGYKGRHRELSPEELIGLLVDAFGFSEKWVWNEYGMTELSSQGYGKLEEGRHRFPPWLKVRVVDPATGTEAGLGQRGLLHFYDLANIHSVMAVATLDTGIREGDAIRLTGRLTGAPVRGCSLPFDL